MMTLRIRKATKHAQVIQVTSVKSYIEPNVCLANTNLGTQGLMMAELGLEHRPLLQHPGDELLS